MASRAIASRLSSWPALLAVAVLTGFTVLFLHVDKQWEVASLAGAVVIAAAGSARLGWLKRAEASFTAHDRALGAAALLAAVSVIGFFYDSHFALLMLTTVMLYAVACLGLTIQFGYAGVVNFAGAAFFGIGAYTAAVAGLYFPQFPHVPVLLLGGAAAALIGSLLFLPILRTRGHYAALITIAFGILFKTFLEVNDTLGGPQGLKVAGFTLLGWSFNRNIELGEETEVSFYLSYALLALLLLSCSLLLVKRLERSWIGLTLDAVRLDETAASVFGIEVGRAKIFAFSLGNFLTGVAGAVMGMMTGFVAPTSFTLADSLILVSIVILGGVGNAWGMLPAAALVIILPEKLQLIQEYRFLLFAALVIVILLFRPQGLFPRRLRQFASPWKR
jgi:ABC-type branched-subunit amino acid transport system permease subunit